MPGANARRGARGGARPGPRGGRAARSRGPGAVRAEGDGEAGARVDGMDIPGLANEFCDDFVCQSSPAVEQCVRTLGRDIVDTKWRPGSFARTVEYEGPFRRFTGFAGYESTNRSLAEGLQGARAQILRMEMVELDKCQIDYVLTGRGPAGEVEVTVRSLFTMNVITGKVEKHADRFDFAGNALAGAVFRAQQASLGAGELAAAAQKRVAELAADLLEPQEPDIEYYADPTDPNKFFSQEDTTMNDALTFGTILAFLYLVARAVYELEQLKN